MDLIKLKERKLQRKIVKLIEEVEETESFIEMMIKKASKVNGRDIEAMRENVAVFKGRTNKKIEKYKKKLMELRQKVV